MRVLAALTAVCILAAGCASSSDSGRLTTTPPADEPDPSAPVAFEPDEGALIGRMVDADEWIPIAGANVSLVELERQTRSASDGAFQFSHLPVGVYTLVADADGYEPAAARVTIEAAAIAEAGLQLVPIPTPEVAYYSVGWVWHGHIGCSFGLSAMSTQETCGRERIGPAQPLPVVIDPNSNWSASYRGDPGVTAIHWELTWDQSHTLSARALSLSMVGTSGAFNAQSPSEAGNFTTGCAAKGKSPIVHTCFFTPKGTDFWNDHIETLDLQVRASGNNQIPLPTVISPDEWLDDQSGVVTQQGFTFYLATFHWGHEIPDGFRLRPDE